MFTGRSGVSGKFILSVEYTSDPRRSQRNLRAGKELGISEPRHVSEHRQHSFNTIPANHPMAIAVAIKDAANSYGSELWYQIYMKSEIS